MLQQTQAISAEQRRHHKYTGAQGCQVAPKQAPQVGALEYADGHTAATYVRLVSNPSAAGMSPLSWLLLKLSHLCKGTHTHASLQCLTATCPHTHTYEYAVHTHIRECQTEGVPQTQLHGAHTHQCFVIITTEAQHTHMVR